MIFGAVCLATFWAWEFLYINATWMPEYISYFLVPLMAYGMLFLPHVVLLAMAAAAVVGLLHRLTALLVKRERVALPRRRSNVPPLP